MAPVTLLGSSALSTRQSLLIHAGNINRTVVLVDLLNFDLGAVPTL